MSTIRLERAGGKIEAPPCDPKQYPHIIFSITHLAKNGVPAVMSGDDRTHEFAEILIPFGYDDRVTYMYVDKKRGRIRNVVQKTFLKSDLDPELWAAIMLTLHQDGEA